MEAKRTDFEKYVAEKSVAFVGMSPSIKDKHLGSEIDSFDIVYRTNMFPIPSKLQEDYGIRCEIISYQKYYKDMAEQFQQGGVKLHVPHLYESEREAYKYPFLFISREEREQMALVIRNQVGEGMIYPSAGLVAYFITQTCSRFKYFGITGYQNKEGVITNHNQDEHYIPEYKAVWKERRPEIENTQMVNNPVHNFEAQNEYIKYLIKNKLVEIDSFSKQYFK